MTQIEITDLARDALYTKVNTMNGECVHKTGSETIAGTKTFTGTVKAVNPTEDTTSSTQIDTVGARNTKLSNYVSKSGDETIAGTKTFSSTPSVPRLGCTSNGVNNNFDFQHSSKAGGWYLYGDKLSGSNDAWYQIITQIGSSLSQNGYVKFDNGIIIQWGYGSIGERATQVITLPTPFSNTNYSVVAGQATVSTPEDSEVTVGAGKTSASQITIYTHYINPNTVDYSWVAIGY